MSKKKKIRVVKNNLSEIKKEKYNIEIIYHSFLENLKGLSIFVRNLAPVAKKHDENTQQELINNIRHALIQQSKHELSKKKKR